MIDDKREQRAGTDEVEEMLAELEGRDVSSVGAETTTFPSGFQAIGKRAEERWPTGFGAVGEKRAPAPRWPTGFTARGGKDAPRPRWSTRFIASGTKPAR